MLLWIVLTIVLFRCSLQYFSNQKCLVDITLMLNIQFYVDGTEKSCILGINCINFGCNQHFQLCSWVSCEIFHIDVEFVQYLPTSFA
jgi:hypothetical protein